MVSAINVNKQFRLLLMFGLLFMISWPAFLHADTAPESHASAPSSFLLVASQQMSDPGFRKTVLLVTKHGNTGPIGVIINRPKEIRLDKIFPSFPAAKNFQLFFGGPAYPKQISYLVRGGEVVDGSLMVSKGIYLAYDLPSLGEMLDGKRHYKDLRVMHGLASWASGQLEYEIKLGDWYVLPFDETVIFERPIADIWQELFNRANSIAL
jgi:putative transcriptional regulator